ncbi:MAG: S41 family peptidase [Phycisphaerae bacterium]|nr:S41 family peptidase [Phycisphaerae bacterium]
MRACTYYAAVFIALPLQGTGTAEAMAVGATRPAESAASAPFRAQPFDAERQFERVWQIVNDSFWDPGFNGVDWREMRKQYLPLALQCEDTVALGAVINDMLGQLRTSHTAYYTPDDVEYYAFLSMIEPANPILRCGIGLDAAKVDGDYFVRALLARDVGERAGLRVGDRLISVNGKPFHPVRSFRGMDGRTLTLRVQRHRDREPFDVTVRPRTVGERTRVFQDATSARAETIGGSKIGYVRLWWLFDPQTTTAFPGIVAGLLDRQKVEGIILDVRDGLGGSYQSYVTPFFLPPAPKVQWRTLSRKGIVDVPSGGVNACDVPLVVLINGGSRSGKEGLAYVLKKTRRALLVGERTAGFVSGGHPQRLPEDAILYTCQEMYEIDGVRLEGKGVEPDVEVKFDIRYCNGKDPQLETARKELVTMILQRNATRAATQPFKE